MQILKSPVAIASMILPALGLLIVGDALVEFSVNPSNLPKDEDWHAHLWQILIVLQLFCILLFVFQSRQSFKEAWPVLMAQVGLIIANLAPIYLLGW